MAENDLNAIRPVQGPQGLTSTKRREEGRKREQRHHNDSENQNKEQTHDYMIKNDDIVEDSSDIHTVDYRA